MKLPKTFIPDKDLGKKIETLIGLYTHPVEATSEELNDPFMYFLYGENTTTAEKDKIEELAVCKIVQDSLEKNITWEEDGKLNEDYKEKSKRLDSTISVQNVYKTKVTILNYKNTPIIMPAIFAIINNKGYLSLGIRPNPCTNTYDEKVRKLAIEHFKMDPKTLF